MALGVELSRPRPHRSNSNAALLLACFGALLAFLDVTIVNVAFPSIQHSFPGSSYGYLSWVLNSYNIVFAALLVAAGRLADLFGRRRAFSSGVLVFTLASVGCALSPTAGALIAFRGAQAVGAALLVPASLALVIDAVPAARRAHAVGIWGATAAFAAGIGPPLGGALVEADGWRLAFLINVPLGLAALAWRGHALVESRAPGYRKLPDLGGATLLGASTALITLGVVQGPSWGWGNARVFGVFIVAAVMLAAFVVSSRQHPVPLLDPQLLRIPTFAVANLLTFVAGVGFYAYLLNNILWLHYVWGYGLLRSGLAVAPGALVAAAVAAVMGEVADRRGYRLVVLPGALIWTGAYVWYLSAVHGQPDFLGQWLPGQVLSGIGVGMTLPIVASAALKAVPGGRYASASAIISSTRQLGAVLGIALLVVIVGTPGGTSAETAFRHGWLLSLVCFAITAVIAIGLRPAGAVAQEVTLPLPRVESLPVAAEAGRAGPSRGASSLLSKLTPQARAQLLDSAALVTVQAGRWLFAKDDPADAMYVVRAGRLEVMGAEGPIRELGAGDAVGELGLLSGAPRSAGIRARRDSTLWRVTPEQFDEALRHDGTARAVMATLAEQLQASQSAMPDEPGRLPRVVALVGVGDGAPVDEVATLLERELGPGRRLHVTRSITAAELHQREPDNDLVVLVAADPSKRWHRFCLRQADRVVVVADAASPPPPELAGPASDGYVVLVGATRTGQAVRWHDALSPRVVRAAAATDLAPVVAEIGRRLTGRAVGLAISGGGARALSAIGVFEEMAAAGIVVDRYSGCSLGSVVAGLFAAGYDADTADAMCFDEFVRRNPFNDYRLSSRSIARGHKAEAAIARSFGEVHLEELPHELAIVSTDLLRREVAVHRRGLVSTAIRASLSLPALFPPTRIGDSWHVDGGVLVNLPVGTLADFEEGPVIAVNVSASPGSQEDGVDPQLPSLGETLMRSMLIGSELALDDARRRATIMVTPDTRGIGLLEFHQIDQAREAGRAAGRAVVEALQGELSAAGQVAAVRGV